MLQNGHLTELAQATGTRTARFNTPPGAAIALKTARDTAAPRPPARRCAAQRLVAPVRAWLATAGAGPSRVNASDNPEAAGVAPMLSAGALWLADGQALAWCEMARGLLLHLVQLGCCGRCAGLPRAGAHQWNFHPQGALAQAVAALASNDPAPAAMLAAAFDPCVRCTMTPKEMAMTLTCCGCNLAAAGAAACRCCAPTRPISRPC